MTPEAQRLWQVLRLHRSQQHAITNRTLARAVGVTERELQAILQEQMRRWADNERGPKVPLFIACGRGQFMVDTDNPRAAGDIEHYIKSLESRMTNLGIRQLGVLHAAKAQGFEKNANGHLYLRRPKTLFPDDSVPEYFR